MLDAGALCELLLGRGFEREVASAIAADGGPVLAPALLDIEVLSALRRLVGRGAIGGAVADVAVQALRAAPIERVAHHGLTTRVWALRERLTPYDAAYLALAEVGETHGGPAVLVTADGRFGRTARSIGSVPVVVVPVP